MDERTQKLFYIGADVYFDLDIVKVDAILEKAGLNAVADDLEVCQEAVRTAIGEVHFGNRMRAFGGLVIVGSRLSAFTKLKTELAALFFAEPTIQLSLSPLEAWCILSVRTIQSVVAKTPALRAVADDGWGGVAGE